MQKKKRQSKYAMSPLGELAGCPMWALAFVCQKCGGGYFFAGKDRCDCAQSHKFKALRVKICVSNKWELFDSLGEAERWSKLKYLNEKGVISNLKRSAKYPFEINGVKITWYESDFEYDFQSTHYTEDFKGRVTKEFRIKAALMKALYPAVNLVLTKRSTGARFFRLNRGAQK